MASYNTSGVTSYTDTSSIAGISAASGQNYGSSSSGSSSSGLMSSSSSRGRNRDADMYAGSKYAPTSNAGTAKAKQRFTAHATSSDDNNNYTPSALAPKFEAAGATLPPATDPRDRFRNTVASSLYDSDIFKPYVPDPTEEIESYLANTAVEDALKDALGIDDTARQMYQGIPTQEEPEPNIDMSVLQGALQPEPITVEELPDTAGLMTRPKARPEGLGAPIVRSYRDPVKVAVTTDKTASNIKAIQQALTDMGYKPNGVDGKVGGGTKRALRKFQAANNLPITGELTQEVADLLTNGKSAVYPDMPVPSAPVKDFDTNDFDVFSGAVASIESGNHGYTTYAYPTRVGNKLYKKGDLLYGGDGGHYLGRYQMGKDALADVGRKYTPTLNEAFLRDPALQDKLFKKYTMKNHKHLTINSEKYRNMTDQEKLGILGYAHNQGATAAEEYLFTGQVGADAFGTKGTKYTDTIAKALGN